MKLVGKKLGFARIPEKMTKKSKSQVLFITTRTMNYIAMKAR